ncbi:MAG TPA: hypothetical protein VLH08_19575 [Acidobacteriota bacterium]|nr:hypothetical protein [Acidobacteriota bacterium]
MKSLSIVSVLLLVLLSFPLFAEQQTWKDVSVIDTMCLSKVKEDPDKHPRKCLLQCEMSGYGILDSEGKYLKFDDAGNEKFLALLKDSDKKDHIRVTVEGEQSGDTIKVTSVSFN